METSGDVLGALGWGLRKYAWLVALFVVALGILVPYLLSRGPAVYDAQAQVGPRKVLNLPNLTPLPRLGDTVFNNGSVGDAVRHVLGLPAGVSVLPQRAELIAAQDNIVFAVIGHGSTPDEAVRVADAAASAFVIELNKYSYPSKPQDAAVGEFLVQHSADIPSKPAPRLGGGSLSVAIGLLAGAVAGVGAVALLLVVRRPILDAASAEQVSGAPVLGGIWLPSRSRSVDDRDLVGVAALCRRLLASSSDYVMLTSHPKAATYLHPLGSAMEAFFRRFGGVKSMPGNQAAETHSSTTTGSSAVGGRRQMRFIVVDKPSLEDVATLPASALTLLVVPRGISMRALREAAAEYFTGGPAGLVLLQSPRWYQRRGRQRARRTSDEAEGLSRASFPMVEPTDSTRH